MNPTAPKAQNPSSGPGQQAATAGLFSLMFNWDAACVREWMTCWCKTVDP
jgi:hypothetical protein